MTPHEHKKRAEGISDEILLELNSLFIGDREVDIKPIISKALDRAHKEGELKALRGSSRFSRHQLTCPRYLFYSQECDCGLSEIQNRITELEKELQ